MACLETCGQIPQIAVTPPASETPSDDMGNCCQSPKESFKGFGKPDYRLERAVIKEAFLDSGKIAKALIITYPERQVNATGPPDFHPPEKTLQAIMDAVEGRPNDLAEKGIDLGEDGVYIPGKVQPGVAIYATHPQGGGCIVHRTPQSLILALYTKDQNPDAANRIVLEMVDLLAQEDESSDKETENPKHKKKEKESKKKIVSKIKYIANSGKKETKIDESDDHEYEAKVNDMLYKTGKLDKVCIVCIKKKTIFATAPDDFRPPMLTINNVLNALEGDTAGLAENGVDLGDGKMYVPGKVDEGETIVSVCPSGGGCIVYKTKLSLIIATYDSRHNPSAANRLIYETAQEIKDDGR